MKLKIIFKFIFFSFLVFPNNSFATEDINSLNDRIFKAQIINITEEEKIIDNNIKTIQQNIEFKSLEKNNQNKIYNFYGIDNFDPVKKNIYKKGDKILALETNNHLGEKTYYIIDYIRSKNILFLIGIFIFILILFGKNQGLRSLLSLSVTFGIIFFYFLPQINNHSNILFPLLTSVFLILIAIIYLSEGFNPVSHISFLSIVVSLSITSIFAYFFVEIGNLSGFFSEETLSLATLNPGLNIKGLLLAGIIFGSLGILDDIIISQVALVKNLSEKTNDKKNILKEAFKIGKIHIRSMINTLFLAYTSVSLPLLVFISADQTAFSSFEQIINNEDIATEIIRSLIGGIGILISVPIATFFSYFYFAKK